MEVERPSRIAIRRARGGHLVIEDAVWLAMEFFEHDVSSAAADSYDEQDCAVLLSEPVQVIAHLLCDGHRLRG